MIVVKQIGDVVVSVTVGHRSYADFKVCMEQQARAVANGAKWMVFVEVNCTPPTQEMRELNHKYCVTKFADIERGVAVFPNLPYLKKRIIELSLKTFRYPMELKIVEDIDGLRTWLRGTEVETENTLRVMSWVKQQIKGDNDV